MSKEIQKSDVEKWLNNIYEDRIKQGPRLMAVFCGGYMITGTGEEVMKYLYEYYEHTWKLIEDEYKHKD